jgi:hypothetical protein
MQMRSKSDLKQLNDHTCYDKDENQITACLCKFRFRVYIQIGVQQASIYNQSIIT